MPPVLIANALELLSLKRLSWQVSNDVFVIAVSGVVGTVIVLDVGS